MWKGTLICVGVLAIAVSMRPGVALGQQTTLSPIPDTAAPEAFYPEYDPSAGQVCPVHGNACPKRPNSRWNTVTKPRLQYSHWGYPEEFEERPFGASYHAMMRTQICNGLEAQMTLWEADFVSGAAGGQQKLTWEATKRLDKIVSMMQTFGFPTITIEISENPAVNKARRELVLKLLAEKNFAVPEESVVVGEPIVRGLDVIEANAIRRNMLEQTRSGTPFRGGTAGVAVGGSNANLLSAGQEPEETGATKKADRKREPQLAPSQSTEAEDRQPERRY